MEQLDQISNAIALSMGAAWASGLNLYATVLVLGLMGANGDIVLPPGLDLLTNPLVIAAAGLMFCVEFFADKVPGVDSTWDGLHTFVRIPAGAMLAAGAVGEMSPAVELAAALLGGTLAAGTHATKAGTRMLVNTSPEPFTNWGLSVGEDVAVVAGLWTALNHPVAFLTFLLCFVVLIVWLLPKIWRGVRLILATLARLIGRARTRPTATPPPE